ncbi:MAG: hypothetical protein XD36_2823 [Halomonas sp. 54_146]|nr:MULTISPECIES: hypothetical protein [unclassified Halomonas]KUJ86771.1 MAG: hypothetical protein XD36_2823 [Halomonas sp. 54_146]HAA44895.1 hypothetical protein [Halomonas sp.]
MNKASLTAKAIRLSNRKLLINRFWRFATDIQDCSEAEHSMRLRKGFSPDFPDIIQETFQLQAKQVQTLY